MNSVEITLGTPGPLAYSLAPNIRLSPATLIEGAPVATVAGTLSLVNPLAPGPFTYTLVTGSGDRDNGLFSISVDQLLSGFVFDRSAQQFASVRVRVVDSASNQYEKPLVVSIQAASQSGTIFVDAAIGDDAYPGTSLQPKKTMQAAVDASQRNTTIILGPGSYGSLTESNKALKIVGAPDSGAVITGVALSNGQLTLDNLAISGPVTVTNTTLKHGAVDIRESVFTGTAAIELSGVLLVSIHGNTITTTTGGIRVFDTLEANISSNSIAGTSVPVSVEAVKRIDFYNNSVNDGDILFFEGFAALENYQVSYLEVTPSIILAKQVTLVTGGILDVAFNVSTGTSQERGVDFIVAGSVVSWGGLPLESYLRAGDYLRIIWTETSGDAGRHTRLDSNNITNIVSGLVLASGGGGEEIKYNNFWNTPGAPTTDHNIAVDPLYNSPTDLRLDPLSPSRDTAFAERWGDQFLTMAPGNRFADADHAERFHVKTGFHPDMGAFENLDGSNAHTGTSYFVGESGYDVVYGGDELDPNKTLNRPLSLTVTDPILLAHGAVFPNSSTRRMTVTDSSLELASVGVSILDPRAQGLTGIKNVDTAFIRPYKSSLLPGGKVYVSEEGNDSTGDGSLANPFRSIDRALTESAPNVVVLAGVYSTFTGVAGKRVVMVPKDIMIDRGASIVTDISASAWSAVYGAGMTGAGATSVGGGVTGIFLPGSITFGHL